MKRILLLSTVSLCLSALSAPAAYASNECGTGATVTCSGNFNATGISYSQLASIAVTVADGTIINYAGQGFPGVVAVSTRDISRLTLGAGTEIHATGNSAGIAASGLNQAEIISAANITTTYGRGIDAWLSTGSGTRTGIATINVTNTGSINVAGISAAGISAISSLGGRISVTTSGDITTSGGTGRGIFARSFFQGGAPNSVTEVSIASTGTISTSGANAQGIYTWAEYGGSVTIEANNVITTGSNANAVEAYSLTLGGSAGGNGAVMLTTTGTISSAQGRGIYVGSDDGSVTVNVTSGEVYGRLNGIVASSTRGLTTVNVAAGATVRSDDGAIRADATAQSTGTVVNALGRVSSSGSYGIYAVGHGVIDVTAHDVSVSGTADGIVVYSFDGTVATVNAVNVRASGEDVAALAFTAATATGAAGNSNTVNIAAGGTVSGGWSATTAPNWAAALLLLSNTATVVNNAGTMTAGSDMAILSREQSSGSPLALTVNNSGTIIGSMLMDSRNVTFNNLAGGVYDLRLFADTDGNGVRDTLAIAVADLGTSGNTVFNNAGTLALQGHGADPVATLDTTGMYLPFGNSFNTMAATSPVQGHILGVQTFENSGVIDLTANPVAGDVLVISGGHTAGTDGGGVYVANRGSLRLNTVFNQGGANSQSDILVVDSTRLGSGATVIIPTPVGPIGNLPTIGNGIALVEVLNKGASANGVFALGSRIASPLYDYQLYHNGVGSDAADGNWYLRNTVKNPEEPNGPLLPNVRPEVALSMAIPPLALEYGYAMLGTLHERVGETWVTASAPVTEQRVVKCRDAAQNYRCVVRVPVATGNGAEATRWVRSGWARLIGDRGFQETNNFMTRGPDYSYTFGGIQAGFDVFAREQADGTLDKAGIYVGYGEITADVKGQLGAKAGSVNMDAYTLGAYWTHHSAQGWYTDAVVQSTWYGASAHSIYGQQIKPDGLGILGSLEAGYAFKLGNGFTLEPQAQIVYQQTSFDDSRDAYAFVRFDEGESLRGRIGLRVAKTWNTADQGREPRLVTAWLRANVWHEFLDKTKTAFGSLDGQNLVPFHSYFGGTWGEIGAGMTAQVSDKINLFATGAYNRSLDNKGRETWDGRLGMTVRW